MGMDVNVSYPFLTRNPIKYIIYKLNIFSFIYIVIYCIIFNYACIFIGFIKSRHNDSYYRTN